MGLFIYEDRPWLPNVLRASKNKYSLFTYGSEGLRREIDRFYNSDQHKIEPYEKKYRPNPFAFQYDLEMHLFLNYHRLYKREEKIILDRLKKKDTPEDRARLEQLRTTQSVSGIPRHEHLFNAAEIRWPTIEHQDKGVTYKLDGSFIRDPWSIRRMEAVASNYNYIFAFGGGGQGKTWTFLGFLLMVFEHFIFTRNGAKVSFSSVNKDKINGVQWPHLQKLVMDTMPDRSLYAGKSIVAGDWTLKRPGKYGRQDTGGVLKGILVGRNVQDAVVIDKLTGTHGHEAYGYLIDEMQSTPQAPIEAAGNYCLTGVPSWIIGAGNYSDDGDTLGSNTKPYPGGWGTVDEYAQKWISEACTGKKALVLHFNNNLSPGVTDKRHAKLFPYLPNKKKLDQLYPSAAKRNEQNPAYRRFWLGWRMTDIQGDRALSDQLVIAGRAHDDLDLDENYRHQTFASFDSAESMGDRNVLGTFKAGIERATEERVWGLHKIRSIQSVHDPRRHHEVACDNVLKALYQDGVKSGQLIIDGTKNTGHQGVLHRKGFQCIPLVYHMRLPDGKVVDKYTRMRQPAILVNAITDEYAHQICHDRITFGAWLLREYVRQGKVRGINESMLRAFEEGDCKSLEEEMYRRSFEKKTVLEYGERLKLDEKEEFKKAHKFSPDILDMWFQAAYFAFVELGIPIYDEVDGLPEKIDPEDIDKEPEGMAKVHHDVWVDESMEVESEEVYYGDEEWAA